MVRPGVKFKSVESDSLYSDADLGDIRPHFGVKAVSIHAQIEGGIAKADKPRGKPIFVSRNLIGVWADHAIRLVMSGAESTEGGRQTESGLRLFSEIDKGIDKVLIGVLIRSKIA